MTWLINWYLNHTGKRWNKEYQRLIHDSAMYDYIIGQR